MKTLYTSKHAKENSKIVKTQIAIALLYSTDVQLTIPSLILRERRWLHSSVGSLGKVTEGKGGCPLGGADVTEKFK